MSHRGPCHKHTPFATHTVSPHCPCSSSGLCCDRAVTVATHNSNLHPYCPHCHICASHLFFCSLGCFSKVILTQVLFSPSVTLARAHTHTHILSPPLLHLSCHMGHMIECSLAQECEGEWKGSGATNRPCCLCLTGSPLSTGILCL